MSLKLVGEKCKVELYSDEEGARLVCANVDDCLLGHPGEIGPDCFGAGSVVPDAGVQPPGIHLRADTPLPQSRITPGTLEVGPGAEKAVGDEDASVGAVPAASDSHMVVVRPPCLHPCYYSGTACCLQCSQYLGQGLEDEKWWLKDLHREQAIQEFLKKLSEFKLTDDQKAFYRNVLQKFPFDGDSRRRVCKRCGVEIQRPNIVCSSCLEIITRSEKAGERRLKRRKRHTTKQSGGMIRMPGNRPEPREPEEESLFEVDDEMHGPVQPKVKAEPELQKPVPKVERPEEPEEEEEEEAHGDLSPLKEIDRVIDDLAADEEDEITLIDDMETTWMPSHEPDAMGYVVCLLVQTDEEGDHSAMLTIDNFTIEIMLGDFIEIVEALERLLPRMREIQSP